MQTLLEVFSKLPNELVEWITNILQTQDKSKAYTEVDLATTICSGMWLPGDLVVRKNRDPKVGDTVEVAQRIDGEYAIVTVKVLKLNVKDSTAYVQNYLDPDGRGLVAIGSIISVIDKVIKYGSTEWNKLIQILEISYDDDDILSWLKRDKEYIKKAEHFHDKENNLKRIDNRLKEMK
jgi:hypothetical protein